MIETPKQLNEKILATLVYGAGDTLSELYRVAGNIAWNDVHSSHLYKALGMQYEKGCTVCAFTILEMSIAFSVPVGIQDGVNSLAVDIKSEYDKKAEQSILDTVQRAVEVSILQEGVFDAGEMLTKGTESPDIIETLATSAALARDVACDPISFTVEQSDIDLVIANKSGLRGGLVETGLTDIDSVTLARKEMLLMLGSSGFGKSFYLVSNAVANLRAGNKVLYVTLEMSKQATLDRIIRCALNLTHKAKGNVFSFADGVLVEDDIQALYASELDTTKTEQISELLKSNLRVIEKPEFSYSVADLQGDIDSLEQSDFIPDVVVLDYIALMKLSSPSEPKRTRLADTARYLRAIAKRQNLAMVSAQQTNRDAMEKKGGGLASAAESFDMISVPDNIFECKAEDSEAQRGLFRLYVVKSRSDIKGQEYYCTSALDAAIFNTSSMLATAALKDEVSMMVGA